MVVITLAKIIVAILFLVTTGYFYTPLISNFQEKLNAIFLKSARKTKSEESHIQDDLQCEKPRAKPSFLKVPNLRNSSCLWTECARTKRIRWNIVIFVKSTTRNQALRELIRRTWATVSMVTDAQLQTVFVVGEGDVHQQALINEEFERYQDILQVDIPDVYRNIHQKSLSAMYWARVFLPKDYYYAEAEDDTMVNPFLLQVHMHEFRQSTANRFWPEFPIVCMTKKLTYETPERQSGSKKFVSLEQFEWPFWPDHCMSSMFACSVRIAGDLWKSSRTDPAFHVSDAYITGVLREKIGLPRQMILEAKPSPATHVKGFTALRPNEAIEELEKQWKKIKVEATKDAEFCTCEKAV